MKFERPTLELLQGSKRYNRDWIFKKLDLTLKAGDILAIAGSNGAGKSTLLQCLMGYQSLSGGTLTYEINNRQLSEDERFPYISIVSPYLELPEGYTLQELITFHFGLKAPRKTIDLNQLLEDCKLKAHLHKQILHYSSGMKQRAKLVLGFASACPFLFLDEPTTNLDQEGFDWFDHLMTQVNTEHQIVVIASNQQHETKFATRSLRISEYK